MSNKSEHMNVLSTLPKNDSDDGIVKVTTVKSRNATTVTFDFDSDNTTILPTVATIENVTTANILIGDSTHNSSTALESVFKHNDTENMTFGNQTEINNSKPVPVTSIPTIAFIISGVALGAVVLLSASGLTFWLVRRSRQTTGRANLRQFNNDVQVSKI